jgi:hypothetical protein
MRSGELWGDPEIVNGQNDIGRFSSIAVDAQGDPHICYCDIITYTLKYVVKTSEDWLTAVVDNVPNAGGRCAIALDGQGRPHISYLHGPGPPGFGPFNEVRYAWKEGGVWCNEKVPTVAPPWGEQTPYLDWGHPTSIAVDANGNPHISSYNINGKLEYAVKIADSGWHAEVVDQIDNVGAGCSIALDDQGNPHISYIDFTHARVKYTWKNGGAWDTEIITTGDQPHAYCYPTSFALDANSTPHISYFTAGANLGYIVKIPGSGWSFEIVDGNGVVGVYSSIALDAHGNPHIVYWDYTNGHLKFAAKTGSGWTVDIIDNTGGVGQDASLALGYR